METGEGCFSGRKEHVGRSAADHRVLVKGVRWLLRSGPRSDLPERYGEYESVHKFRQSLRNRPLKLPMKPFSIGLLGRMKHNCTPMLQPLGR